MANLSPQELTARSQQVMADPRVAQVWAQWQAYHARTGVWNPGHGVGGYQSDFYNAVRATGLMPDGYQITFNGPQNSPVLQHKGLPSWVYPLIGVGIAATAGAATGAFGGAAGGAAASGGSAAAADGAYIGADVASTAAASLGPAAAAGGGGLTSTLLRYGAPAIAGAVEGYLGQRNENARTTQAVALAESQLDPFRGTMHQANDVARLEHAANGPHYVTPPPNSPYAANINPANRPPALSSTMLNVTRNAQDKIAHGQGTVPTMTDRNNWGNTGTADLSAPWTPPAGTTPPPLQAPALAPLDSTQLTSPLATAPPTQGLSYFQRMLFNMRRRQPAV